MGALRVSIEVVAGIIPGHPDPQHTRQFIITSDEWHDKTGEAAMKVYGFAQEYMRTLWNPQRVNWVQCVWMYM